MTFGLRFCVDRKRQPPEDLGKEKFFLGNGRCKAAEPGESLELKEQKHATVGKKERRARKEEGRGEAEREGATLLGASLQLHQLYKGFANHYHHFHSVYSHALQWTVSCLFQFFFKSRHKFSWFSLYKTYRIFKFITIHKFLIIINGVFYFLSMHMF